MAASAGLPDFYLFKIPKLGENIPKCNYIKNIRKYTKMAVIYSK
jgi:hypothetical protein